MHLLRTVFLILHVIGGFTALLIGIVPMVAKKGGKVHRWAGWVYTVAMTDVFISSVVLSTIIPLLTDKPVNLFLLFIGVFSFYFLFMGMRTLKFNRPGYKNGPGKVDYVVVISVILFSIVFLTLALRKLFIGGDTFIIVLAVFSAFSLRASIVGLKKLRKPYDSATDKTVYFFNHTGNMIGSYIAAFTAFMVQNAHFIPINIPPMVAWLAPGTIGVMAIVYTFKYYRKELAEGRRLPQFSKD